MVLSYDDIAVTLYTDPIFAFLEIDECSSIVCENSGTCEDGINYYTCICLPGYTGDLCETGDIHFQKFDTHCHTGDIHEQRVCIHCQSGDIHYKTWYSPSNRWYELPNWWHSLPNCDISCQTGNIGSSDILLDQANKCPTQTEIYNAFIIYEVIFSAIW